VASPHFVQKLADNDLSLSIETVILFIVGIGSKDIALPERESVVGIGNRSHGDRASL